MNQYEVRCSNCGTLWFLETVGESRGESSAVCPTCHLATEPSETQLASVASISDLERRLDTLVRSALASGLAHQGILHALREELIFTAERGQTNHRFIVQLIDLGPQEGDELRRLPRDRRDIASSRGNA